jgi:VWFA-related protein
MRRGFAWISIVAATAVLYAAPQKLFVDCNSDELVRAVPELAGMQFDSNQDRLDGLLAATGGDLDGMFAKLVDVAATEQIHEMRFEDGTGAASRRETYRYLIKILEKGAPEPFDELRVDPGGASAPPAAATEFLVVSHFEKLLRYLLPRYREESRFRYLGRAQAAGQDAWLVAFAQRADSADPHSNIGPGNGRTARLQGLVWIDAATRRIVRLRMDLAERIEGSPLETLTMDMAVTPVKFESIGSVFWLPARVTVHARYAGGELHSVHRYADYRLSGSEAADTPSETAGAADDLWEMLDRSISLAGENQAPEAIALLREVLRLNPEMAAARYHLAVTLRATGDFAGAETELRETLRRSPDLGPAHNLLGILLFKRGDAAGAAAELRATVQLQPKDATAHFNLAQVLEKAAPKAALEEYRMASTLAPDNAAMKTRYEQLERSASAAAPVEAAGSTIKVEVRQVLVPVVVTDKEGHHVTGLTQADFHVFEDGVEQKISGFSVENMGAGSPAPGAAGTAVAATEVPNAPAAPSPGKPAAVRRTYLICIDSLNSAFSNLVNVRKALTKLFHSEPAGDARYVVLAVGTAALLVQAPTTDPAAVLKSIEGKEFEKLFLSSRQASTGDDLRAFRRELDQARKACDEGAPECPALASSLPSRASQIAEQERVSTAAFLQQLRELVGQLARETGRRTMVLLSDGFQLVPGRQAFELLDAYFPGTHSSLRAVDRLTELDGVLRLAANRNISIYTIDSRGLYTQSYYDAANPGSAIRLAPTVLGIMNRDASGAGETLSEIAAATGGTAFKNSNDIFAGLERAFADGRQYYVLAYVPANATPDGKFRAITVRVRDGKLPVSAKRGYWAGGG